ncbi:hypothetical protein [Lentibacter sp.]|jgi:hypothetical protein|uniref:hypothetical protein n=1 Tax=Lentibacter sp. TaxID=2024994 RepID=UPI0032D97A50
MHNKKAHGGKREGAGRKPVDFNLVLKVGQAYSELERQEYEAQKYALLNDETNLQEFFDDINSIPVAERKDFIGSDYHMEHSESVNDELKTLGQLPDVHANSSRLIHITRPYRSVTRIRREVAHAFGLSEMQVKNYLQKYREFLKDLD